MTDLIEQLKKHEGFKSHAYKCTAGFNTIGFGYNLDANPLKLSDSEIKNHTKNGITEREATILLLRAIEEIEEKLHKALPCFCKLSNTRKNVLINMAYNLGIVGLFKFRRMIDALEHRQFVEASEQMLASKWAAQVHNRAYELAQQMEIG